MKRLMSNILFMLLFLLGSTFILSPNASATAATINLPLAKANEQNNPAERTNNKSAPKTTTASQKDYNINVTNKTEVEKLYIQALSRRGEKDAQALNNILNQLKGKSAELNQKLAKLKSLSANSAYQPVKAADLLQQTQDFQTRIEQYRLDVQGLAYNPTLRPDYSANKDSSTDMQPIIDHYQNVAENIQNRANQLDFYVQQVNGTTEQLKLHEVEDALSKKLMLSPEKIQQMSQEVLLLRTMPSRDRRVIDTSINHFTFRAINTFIETFGTSQRYRSNKDVAGTERAKNMLLDAFWARSYLRSVFGIKIGSIPVEYNKRLFNIDHFISNMRVPSADAVYDVNQLTNYANQATEAFATVGSSASRKWTSASAWLSWLSGKSNEMDAKFFIIGLMKKDLDEEIMLSQAGGLKKVRDAYKSQYLSDKVSRMVFEQKAKDTFSFDTDDDDDDEDIEADVGMVDSHTLKGSLAQAMYALKNQEERLERAKKLQKQLNELTKNNSVSKRRKKRELFK